MEQLYHKPEGTYMQNALKIYFCGQPQDVQEHFPELSEALLAAHECVIYYADPQTPRTPEFLSALTEIKLFVIPVTAQLLYEENVAMNLEYPFALGHHIPVLPIILDNSIYDEFNRRFEHRHSLFLQDEEFVPKLEACLYALSANQQELQDIQKAFEAQIFLSYRKKDRER